MPPENLADYIVEFRALYADQEGKDYLHHEISTFKKIDEIIKHKEEEIMEDGGIRILKQTA